MILYRCDKCSKEQISPERMMVVALCAAYLPRTPNEYWLPAHVRGQRHWCSTCIKEVFGQELGPHVRPEPDNLERAFDLLVEAVRENLEED